MLGVLASAGKGIGSFALRNPRTAASLGVGYSAFATQSGDIFNAFAKGRSSSGDTSADSGWFTSPSDAIKRGVQLYGENPITSFAAGMITSKMIGSRETAKSWHKFAMKEAGGQLRPEWKTAVGQMYKAERHAAKASKGFMGGLKNIWRAVKPDGTVTNMVSQHLANDAALAASPVGKSIAARINTISKAKRITNFATWAWAAQSAYDISKSLFSGSTPPSHITPTRTTSLGGTFNDSSEAYTQRRRAIEAMHNSQFSGRSAMGNEAALMHN